MRAVKLDTESANDPQCRQLYETAFPREEQIPYDDLVKLLAKMPLDYTAWHCGDSLVGITIVYQRPTTSWFWYFAVREELRGRGYGGRILEALKGRYAHQPLILDMESPQQAAENSEQRQRRHAFYKRHGFRDTGVGRSLAGIDYTIMMAGEGTFTMTDYDRVIEELRSFWDKMPKDGSKRQR